MSARDEKLRTEILKHLYELFKEDPAGFWTDQAFFDGLEGYDENEIIYNVERMDGQLLENRGALGKRISMIHITPDGIEDLHQKGIPTILDGDTRYELLNILYSADRQQPGQGYIGREDLIEESSADEAEVHKNVWYLKEKHLVETSGGGGGYFYHRLKITRRGSQRFEQYEEHGVGIPRVNGRASLRQASIGPDEPEKAENLFRDLVELSRDEVVIVDRFAREGLYDLLRHVPEGVEIKVLTTDRVTGEDYRQRVTDFENQHSDIEVRYLSDSDWDFHDRYIFVDREDGWAWGHSFHDAGETQHTASELKPVNRDTIIKQFESGWKNASVVI